MLEKLLQKDRELLIYLNNLGNKQWDAMWLAITHQFNWILLFVIVLGLIFWKFRIKKTIFILLFIVILVAFSDQFTNLIKNFTGRVRPCNVLGLQEYLRQFKYKPHGFGFWSGHAHLSTTFTVFTILLLRSKIKLIYVMLLFPVVFGYSRIYLGVHYPLDIITGYITGAFMGFIFYKTLKFFFKIIFKERLM